MENQFLTQTRKSHSLYFADTAGPYGQILNWVFSNSTSLNGLLLWFVGGLGWLLSSARSPGVSGEQVTRSQKAHSLGLCGRLAQCRNSGLFRGWRHWGRKYLHWTSCHDILNLPHVRKKSPDRDSSGRNGRMSGEAFTAGVPTFSALNDPCSSAAFGASAGGGSQVRKQVQRVLQLQWV